MAKRIKVPRASIACTILDDPDFIGLMQDDSGRQAFALFCAMLAAAKAQDNGGRFEQASVIVAVMVRWPLHEFNIALKDLAARTDWVTVTTTITIRSFKKWNSWGGKRDSSGAPNGNQNACKIQSENNQDAPKIQSNMDMPVSVSVSDLKATTLPTALDKPKRRSWAGDWEPTLAKLLVEQGTAADRCKLLNHAGGIAGKPACETLLRELEGRQWVAKDCGHAYAYLTSALKAKVAPAAQNKVSVQYQRGDEAYGN